MKFYGGVQGGRKNVIKFGSDLSHDIGLDLCALQVLVIYCLWIFGGKGVSGAKTQRAVP